MSSGGVPGPGQVGLPRQFVQLPQVGRDANVPPPAVLPQALPVTYLDSALVQNTLYIRDAQYWLAIPPANGTDAWDGASPVIHFDDGDYFVFNRATDEFDIYLDAAKAASLSSSGALSLAGGLTAGGDLTTTGNANITGMAVAGNGFQLDPGAWWHISTGGGPIQYWDTDDTVFFYRGGDLWTWAIGGTAVLSLGLGGANLQGLALTAGAINLPNQTARAVFAAPAGAAGPPTFRQLTQADVSGQVSLTTGVTGILPVANGGTGVTTSTGTGANVLGTSPTLTTPTISGATAHGVLLGNSPITSTGAGAIGQTLTSQGAGADPVFTNGAAGSTGTTGQSPAAPTSTTAAMAGLGAICTFTPTRNGRVMIFLNGVIRAPVGASAGTGLLLVMAFGTGAAPANGAAVTGTNVTPNVRAATSSVVGGAGIPNDVPVTLCAMLTGLTVGTAYWVDVTQALTLAGQTASLISVAFNFMEQ
jgi:hypothetical protein